MARCTREHATETPFSDDGFSYRALSPAQRGVAASICSAILAGALPPAGAEYRAGLRHAVRGLDTVIAGLQPGVQADVQQLFGLLESPLTRFLTTGIGSSIAEADAGAVSAFLERWRYSRLAVLRSAYGALHQLVYGAWYGQNCSWAKLGYPGPPKLV